MKVNGEYLWFEGLFVIIKDIKYCLIKKHDEKINNKFKIKSFKELNNILREYDNKNKQYYLIFQVFLLYQEFVLLQPYQRL